MSAVFEDKEFVDHFPVSYWTTRTLSEMFRMGFTLGLGVMGMKVQDFEWHLGTDSDVVVTCHITYERKE